MTYRCLDLFCGAGGAAMGYHRAGFEVVGVDINPQPRFPFEFYQADAMTFPLDGFHLVHASPPCQKFSVASQVHINRGKEYKDLLTPIRERLKRSVSMYVIENVMNAPMHYPIILCGLMFDLKVFRHRLFESNAGLLAPPHPSHKGKRIGEEYFSVAGGAGRWESWGTVKRSVNKGSVDQWRQAMGIDWMTRKELTQAIPPAYTEFIGKQLITILKGQSMAKKADYIVPDGILPELADEFQTTERVQEKAEALKKAKISHSRAKTRMEGCQAELKDAMVEDGVSRALIAGTDRYYGLEDDTKLKEKSIKPPKEEK